MGHYKNWRVPGGPCFFTVHLQNRNSDLLITQIEGLRRATRLTMDRYPFRIDAIVVLPASIHTIWTLPPGDVDFSMRWSMLKTVFSRSLPDPDHRTRAQIERGEKGIWQRRFWGHAIGDAAEYAQHQALIHAAPVTAGLVKTPSDWPHSSIHRDSRAMTIAKPNAAPSQPLLALSG